MHVCISVGLSRISEKIFCTGSLSSALFIWHQNLKNQKEMLTFYYTDGFTGILFETNRMGRKVTDQEEQIKV